MRELSAEQEETFKSKEGNARALGIKRKSKKKKSILGKIKLLVGKKLEVEKVKIKVKKIKVLKRKSKSKKIIFL